MANLLFDFGNPDTLLTKATKATNRRRSGTVADTVRHSVVHTQSPDSTIHHCIIAACAHPQKAQADEGIHYMVGYVSIPLEWITRLDAKFCDAFGISFIGPAGSIQKIPPTLKDMEDIFGERLYIGIDFFHYMRTQTQQPSYQQMKTKLVEALEAIR